MTTPPLRVVFMGTPDFAVPALQCLFDSAHEVVAVYSQPPRPKGRGQQVQKSPVHLLAEARNIPVFTPLSLKKDPAAVETFISHQADIAVVAAYGLILPLSVLEAPRFGCLNIHASLLPRWRGASPIQHAIWHGDKETGVTIMQMAEGLDTGPMLLKSEVPIRGMTAQQLHDRLAGIGGPLCVQVVDMLARGEPVPLQMQNEAETTYAKMLKKEDGRIDWALRADQIDAQVRALNPWPGTYTQTASGQRLKILAGAIVTSDGYNEPGTLLNRHGVVATGAGAYQVQAVQPENAKAMETDAAINGHYLRVGETFAS